MSTAAGIQIVDQKNLLASTQDTSAVLANSFIVLACANGYTNTGGSLNVSCSSAGSWSQFPNCVVSGGSGVTTTTVTSNTGVGCSIDTSAFTINNGYYTSSSLKYTSATAATGEYIQYGILSLTWIYYRIDTIFVYARIQSRFGNWWNIHMYEWSMVN